MKNIQQQKKKKHTKKEISSIGIFKTRKESSQCQSMTIQPVVIYIIY